MCTCCFWFFYLIVVCVYRVPNGVSPNTRSSWKMNSWIWQRTSCHFLRWVSNFRICCLYWSRSELNVGALEKISVVYFPECDQESTRLCGERSCPWKGKEKLQKKTVQTPEAFKQEKDQLSREREKEAVHFGFTLQVDIFFPGYKDLVFVLWKTESLSKC